MAELTRADPRRLDYPAELPVEGNHRLLVDTALSALRDTGGVPGEIAEVALAARLWSRERRYWRYSQDPQILTRAEKRLAAAVSALWSAGDET